MAEVVFAAESCSPVCKVIDASEFLFLLRNRRCGRVSVTKRFSEEKYGMQFRFCSSREESGAAASWLSYLIFDFMISAAHSGWRGPTT